MSYHPHSPRRAVQFPQYHVAEICSLKVSLINPSGNFEYARLVPCVGISDIVTFSKAVCDTLIISYPTPFLRFPFSSSELKERREILDHFLLPSDTDLVVDLHLASSSSTGTEFVKRGGVRQSRRPLTGFFFQANSELHLQSCPGCQSRRQEQVQFNRRGPSFRKRKRRDSGAGEFWGLFSAPDSNIGNRVPRISLDTSTESYATARTSHWSGVFSHGSSRSSNFASSTASYMTVSESFAPRAQKLDKTTDITIQAWLASRECLPELVIRKESLYLCNELWSLRAIASWLFAIAEKWAGEPKLRRECLVSALCYLLYNRHRQEYLESLKLANEILTSLETSTPPVLEWRRSSVCWRLNNAQGVILALLSNGCYTPSIHRPICFHEYQKCYAPSCSARQQVQGRPMSEAWFKLLESTSLLPDPDVELDWSGRGQHAEFKRAEDVPLRKGSYLGFGGSARVQSVMCKRIRLACKSVRSSSLAKRKEALKEVMHLQTAQHSHVIRMVGTYVFEKGGSLNILMYPVTEFDLGSFMDSVPEHQADQSSETASKFHALKSFFPCLVSTLDFLHAKHIKHMDIKPKNILVRDMQRSEIELDWRYKMYLTDFGIARAYSSAYESETSSATSFTPTHSAPEVVAQETRGFKADVFSLGCVFAKTIATLLSTREELLDIRETTPEDRSFQANLEPIRAYLRDRAVLVLYDSGRRQEWSAAVARMIERDPTARPSARQLKDGLVVPAESGCCNAGPDPFEAAKLSG